MLIYTLIYQEAIIYIGSTILTMKERITVHKRDLNNNKPNLLYKFMRENNITFDDIIVETHPQDFIITLSEIGNRICPALRREEGKWQKILLLEGVKLYQYEIAGQTIKEKDKQYRLNNSEAIKEYKLNNKDKIKEYQKEYQKEYYQTNKEIKFNINSKC